MDSTSALAVPHFFRPEVIFQKRLWASPNGGDSLQLIPVEGLLKDMEPLSGQGLGATS